MGKSLVQLQWLLSQVAVKERYCECCCWDLNLGGLSAVSCLRHHVSKSHEVVHEVVAVMIHDSMTTPCHPCLSCPHPFEQLLDGTELTCVTTHKLAVYLRPVKIG